MAKNQLDSDLESPWCNGCCLELSEFEHYTFTFELTLRKSVNALIPPPVG